MPENITPTAVKPVNQKLHKEIEEMLTSMNIPYNKWGVFAETNSLKHFIHDIETGAIMVDLEEQSTTS